MDTILEYLNKGIGIIVHCNTVAEAREFLLCAKAQGITWAAGSVIEVSDAVRPTPDLSFRIESKHEMWNADREYYMNRIFRDHIHLEWGDCIRLEFDEQAFADFLLGE